MKSQTETQQITPSEIEEVSSDLDFIEENNIQAVLEVEDFRSVLNFVASFPTSPIATKVLKNIRGRIENLRPVELELVAA